MVAGLLHLADKAQHPVSSQHLAVILDPHGRLRGRRARYAEEVRHYLEKPDQLQSVESLGSSLVLAHLGQSGVDGRVVRDQPVVAGEPEVAADAGALTSGPISSCMGHIPPTQSDAA
jgi:hypothetical protein